MRSVSHTGLRGLLRRGPGPKNPLSFPRAGPGRRTECYNNASKLLSGESTLTFGLGPRLGRQGDLVLKRVGEKIKRVLEKIGEQNRLHPRLSAGTTAGTILYTAAAALRRWHHWQNDRLKLIDIFLG